jgi:hypothetical protein
MKKKSLISQLMILGCVLAPTISLAQLAPPAFTNDDDNNSTKHVDMAHAFAYRNFGPAYWQPVGAWNYPVPAQDSAYPSVVGHSITLDPGTVPDEKADPATSWVAIPVNSKSVYYRAEYLLKDVQNIDVVGALAGAAAYYQHIGRRWNPNDYDHSSIADLGSSKNVDEENFHSKAKMTMVLFPTSDFHLKYFPGKELLMYPSGTNHVNGAESNMPALAQPRGGVAWSPFFDKVNPAENASLVGIFKGMFDNEDTRRNGNFPGFIMDGKVVDQPLKELGTVATYKDGTVQVGEWTDIPQANIDRLRQNEYLVLHKGQINPSGAYPIGWNRFGDDIIRSYLVMSADGKYFGYLWTMYMHPSMVAEAMQKLNFSEVMLMDIHPALGARFARPMALETAPKSDFFHSSVSYAFIPEEDQVAAQQAKTSSFLYGWTKMAADAYRSHKPMDWPVGEAKVGSKEDFFGVYLNNVQ